MTPFKGQTVNAGHFLQPATNAIGHSVILNSYLALAILARSAFEFSRRVLMESRDSRLCGYHIRGSREKVLETGERADKVENSKLGLHQRFMNATSSNSRGEAG